MPNRPGIELTPKVGRSQSRLSAGIPQPVPVRCADTTARQRANKSANCCRTAGSWP